MFIKLLYCLLVYIEDLIFIIFGIDCLYNIFKNRLWDEIIF